MRNYAKKNKNEDDTIDVNVNPVEETVEDNVEEIPNLDIQDLDPLLDAEPIVHEYSKAQVIGDINDAPEIPEEVVERTQINISNGEQSDSMLDELDDEEKDFVNGGSSKGGYEPPSWRKESKEDESKSYGNPDLKGKSSKEKKESAKHLAETCADGYEMLHGVALSILQLSDEKLMKQAVKGKIEYDAIDSEMQIGNKVYQMKKLIHDYNFNLQDVLQVDPEVREAIVPLLQEEFERKDIGMTPAQRIFAMLIKDLQPKIVQISALKSTMNQVLKQQTEIIRQEKSRIDEMKKEYVNDPIIVEDTYREPEENLGS